MKQIIVNTLFFEGRTFLIEKYINDVVDKISSYGYIYKEK
jgi:hypothetical protein